MNYACTWMHIYTSLLKGQYVKNLTYSLVIQWGLYIQNYIIKLRNEVFACHRFRILFISPNNRNDNMLWYRKMATIEEKRSKRI